MIVYVGLHGGCDTYGKDRSEPGTLVALNACLSGQILVQPRVSLARIFTLYHDVHRTVFSIVHDLWDFQKNRRIAHDRVRQFVLLESDRVWCTNRDDPFLTLFLIDGYGEYAQSIFGRR